MMRDTSELEIVKLTGKTQKGKNRVREHGKHWFVLESKKHVGCLVGPGMLVSPTVDDHIRNQRWVGSEFDVDFDIERISK